MNKKPLFIIKKKNDNYTFELSQVDASISICFGSSIFFEATDNRLPIFLPTQFKWHLVNNSQQYRWRKKHYCMHNTSNRINNNNKNTFIILSIGWRTIKNFIWQSNMNWQWQFQDTWQTLSAVYTRILNKVYPQLSHITIQSRQSFVLVCTSRRISYPSFRSASIYFLITLFML